jgi:hypothetical protein
MYKFFVLGKLSGFQTGTKTFPTSKHKKHKKAVDPGCGYATLIKPRIRIRIRHDLKYWIRIRVKNQCGGSTTLIETGKDKPERLGGLPGVPY